MKHLSDPQCENLLKGAVDFCDGVVKGEEDLDGDIWDYASELNKPKLEFHTIEELSDNYSAFYLEKMLEEEAKK